MLFLAAFFCALNRVNVRESMELFVAGFAQRTNNCFIDSAWEIEGGYNNHRPIIRSKEGATMDMKAVGLRIKKAREAKKLTQEDLAALVELSPTHISVIEREAG